MRTMSDEHTLYEIDVQTPVSPEELHNFTKGLEEMGYNVVTDLEHGAIELRGENDNYTG